MKKGILFMLLAIVILLAACKPKAESTNDNALTDTTTQDKVEDKPLEKTQETGNDQIKSLFEKMGANVQYKVDYDVVSEQSKNKTTSEQTWVIKNKNMRIDMTAQEGTVSTYIVDEIVYMCTTADEKTTCFEYPSAQNTKSKGDSDLRNNFDAYKYTLLPPKMIAGASTTCFKYTVELVEMNYCYSSEGVPLYIKISGNDGMTEMTATKYSTSVSDSEFTLPVEPQKFAMPDLSGYDIPEGNE